VAQEVSRRKPIVAVKAGRTKAGSRAASSHTAALTSPDGAVDALFSQSGVVRVDTLEELFDVAQVLAAQPLPAGRRVAIVSNSGGPGILAADACEANGLIVPELSSDSQAALRRFLPPAAGVRNPIDLVASGSASDYERSLDVVLADPNIDAVLVLFAPPLVTDADDVARAVTSATEGATKPVVANFLSMARAPGALTGRHSRVPSFPFPESAVRALAKVCDYSDWRKRPVGSVPALPDLDPVRAGATVQAALTRSPDGAWLPPADISALLGAYGIPMATSQMATSAAGAAAAAEMNGFPVALKASGPELVHKTGVRLGLTSVPEVVAAFDEMKARLGTRMDVAQVQPMVTQGVETIVGMVHDPSFGPLVMFGSGGTSVELFGDRSFRILPVTDVDAAELVRSLRGSPLLFGYRGTPAVDVAALEDLLVRVGRLVQDVPEIAEMDLNPVIVSPHGAVAVDAKVRVAPAPTEDDPTVRRLR
jgi:acyl-CoA synthetase (NDP forming)